MEVGCLSHPGVSTIGSQTEDCTDEWQNLTSQPAMSSHALEKTGTRHTNRQWKVIKGGGGGREGKKLKLSTQSAPSSRHTDKQAVLRKPRGIQRMRKYNKTTDINSLQLLLVVNSVKVHLTSFKCIFKFKSKLI